MGPYFDPQFYGKLVLEEEMTFTYGFDLTVGFHNTFLIYKLSLLTHKNRYPTDRT